MTVGEQVMWAAVVPHLNDVARRQSVPHMVRIANSQISAQSPNIWRALPSVSLLRTSLRSACLVLDVHHHVFFKRSENQCTGEEASSSRSCGWKGVTTFGSIVS